MEAPHSLLPRCFRDGCSHEWHEEDQEDPRHHAEQYLVANLATGEKPRRYRQHDAGENQWVEQQIEILDPPREERAEMRRSAGELSYAETMPAFRGIAVDSEDDLWVEEWKGVGLDQGRFLVFRPDGAWLGYVDIPEGLPESRGYPHEQVIEIGSDYLLGVWTGDYGVEEVRLYRIEKR